MKLLARFRSPKTRITKYSEDELRDRLTPEQFRVAQEGGTEAPFSGEYREVETEGTYHCRVCDAELFSSSTKFDPHGAWPAFREPLDNAVGEGLCLWNPSERVGVRNMWRAPWPCVPRRSRRGRYPVLHQFRVAAP